MNDVFRPCGWEPGICSFLASCSQASTSYPCNEVMSWSQSAWAPSEVVHVEGSVQGLLSPWLLLTVPVLLASRREVKARSVPQRERRGP